MTWIIGMPGYPLGALGIADIRVSYRADEGTYRPETRFGVQKLHEIGPSLVAGFSGSVMLGFTAISELRRFVDDKPLPVGQVVRDWSGLVRRAWQHKISEDDKELGLSLLFVGALSGGNSQGFVLRCPAFSPEPIPPRTARSIGSGSRLDDLVRELEFTANEQRNLDHFDGGWIPGGIGAALSVFLGDTIARVQDPTVGEHLCYCRVASGIVDWFTNETEGLSPGAESRVMPPVAHTWKQFEQLAATGGTDAARATAGRARSPRPLTR